MVRRGRRPQHTVGRRGKGVRSHALKSEPLTRAEEGTKDEFGLWFLAKTPAGVVWITPEGQEIWT
ncbi:DUF596 domain-containing protein [Pectobacterium aroidearum]|uniref:DUF596 domain-containing protein n=1 Tax=Pectobacterium aroidearum TaxID=1201031 RepID=UPI00211428A7|nr:DUF596 domain-containing protein [Pectobacterium aroidearum]UUE44949.1 DUF596 domain-containing protein [Pectobacterium aroidearum]UUE49168.1 DUF596 domain-containing protein [Pectobacterium aroidearum]UUE53372.1 DUF596 domain-containing protein [Pectobacterium aroidearum]UUE61783.1 DUF596 domain-containing protein [Pectobacterium aroidearum]UUE66007.1 DUF596 domain-containing protein [Pectobacterium aroidearum]